MRDEDANPALDGKQMRRQWNMYMGEKERKKEVAGQAAHVVQMSRCQCYST